MLGDIRVYRTNDLAFLLILRKLIASMGVFGRDAAEILERARDYSSTYVAIAGMNGNTRIYLADSRSGLRSAIKRACEDGLEVTCVSFPGTKTSYRAIFWEFRRTSTPLGDMLRTLYFV